MHVKYSYLSKQLSRIELDSMGLTTDKERNLIVTQRLLNYKYAVDEGLK